MERYRQAHGVRDRGLALGHAPPVGLERAAWERASRQLAIQQRQLGITDDRGAERGFGIGRELSRARERAVERDMEIGFGP